MALGRPSLLHPSLPHKIRLDQILLCTPQEACRAGVQVVAGDKGGPLVLNQTRTETLYFMPTIRLLTCVDTGHLTPFYCDTGTVVHNK